MDIRLWQPGDEDAILDLFHQVFGRSMPREFWRWRFQDHPSGGPYIALAWDGERLAAHYAVTAAPLSIDGEQVPAALAMTTMTHADYRGRGLLEKVGGALYEELRSKHFCAVWGFPNGQAHLPRLQKLSWIDICDIPTMSLQLDGALKVSATDRSIQEIASINEYFSHICNVANANAPVRSFRSIEALRWRIDQNPVNTYSRFVIGTDQHSIGYIIAKRYSDQEVDIVDFQAADAHEARSLLQQVLERLQQQGIRKVNIWSMPHDPLRQILERTGFVPTAPITFFGGRQFSGLSKDFGDARNWRLSMLDSDIY